MKDEEDMQLDEAQRILEIVTAWESINDSMPSKMKLDAMGVDTQLKTLPTWAKWEQAKANEPDSDMVSIALWEYFAKQIVFDAMWRTAQQIVETAANHVGGTMMAE